MKFLNVLFLNMQLWWACMHVYWTYCQRCYRRPSSCLPVFAPDHVVTELRWETGRYFFHEQLPGRDPLLRHFRHRQWHHYRLCPVTKRRLPVVRGISQGWTLSPVMPLVFDGRQLTSWLRHRYFAACFLIFSLFLISSLVFKERPLDVFWTVFGQLFVGLFFQKF